MSAREIKDHNAERRREMEMARENSEANSLIYWQSAQIVFQDVANDISAELHGTDVALRANIRPGSGSIHVGHAVLTAIGPYTGAITFDFGTDERVEIGRSFNGVIEEERKSVPVSDITREIVRREALTFLEDLTSA